MMMSRRLTGFELDGVTSQQGLKSRAGFNPLDVYPDPTVHPVNVRYMRSPEDFLIVQGENLDLAARKEDVRVSIGTALLARGIGR